MAASDHLGPQFFHVSNKELVPGEHIETDFAKNMQYSNEDEAVQQAKFRGRATKTHVYETTPLGPTRWVASPSRKSYNVSKQGFQVVGKKNTYQPE